MQIYSKMPSGLSATETSTQTTLKRSTFTIGTRKSRLALLQTDIVRDALSKAWPEYEFKIHTRDTAGDLNKVTPLREFTTKNLWTEELEELLIDNHLDLVVHSLKGANWNACILNMATDGLVFQMFQPKYPQLACWGQS